MQIVCSYCEHRTESISGISRGDVYFEVQCHVGQEAHLETLGCAQRGMAVIIFCISLTGLVPALLSHSTGRGNGGVILEVPASFLLTVVLHLAFKGLKGQVLW